MKIVAAVDGSNTAMRALEVAARFAAQIDAELTIVTVRRTAADGDVERFGEIENATVGDILEQEARAILAAAAATARAIGAKRVSTSALDGDPATVLLEKAYGADLLAIGRRGRGRLAGLLLGSVSQKLAALSPAPVVIVP